MKDIIVVTSVSKRAGLLPLLEAQLKEAGIDHHINPLPDLHWLVLSRIESRLRIQREMVEKFQGEYQMMVFVDGFDVLFFGTKEELIKKIPEKFVVLSAEKNCYPDAPLAQFFPDVGVPWRFVNGGCTAGTPESLLCSIKMMTENPAYDPKWIDQQYLNLLTVSRQKPFVLDYLTDLFYCMYLDQGELVMDQDRPRNRVTGNLPSFVHFNGRTDPGKVLGAYNLGPAKEAIV